MVSANGVAWPNKPYLLGVDNMAVRRSCSPHDHSPIKAPPLPESPVPVKELRWLWSPHCAKATPSTWALDDTVVVTGYPSVVVSAATPPPNSPGMGGNFNVAQCECSSSNRRTSPQRTVGEGPPLLQASMVALSSGLPAQWGKTTQDGKIAFMTLEESKKQREQHDALLQQADRHLAHARSLLALRGDRLLRRVGGPESPVVTGPPTRARATIGGNVCTGNVSRARMTIPVVAGTGGTRPTGKGRGEIHTIPSHSTAVTNNRASAEKIGCVATSRQFAPRSPGPQSGTATAAHSPIRRHNTQSNGAFAFQPPPRSPRWSLSPRLSQMSPRGLSPRASSPVATADADESVVVPLLARGLLSSMPQKLEPDVLDDLAHVQALFSAQVTGVEVLGVFRIENSGLTNVYEAVRGNMGSTRELDLWHGTSVECVRNIVLSGFNRAYCGRHGVKLGQGTYFSSTAGYSLRFCGRKRGERCVMLFAKVLIGEWARGTPDLVEPPYRNAEQMARYDCTVDDVVSPSMFCIFRDFQALPCYLVEFRQRANAANRP